MLNIFEKFRLFSSEKKSMVALFWVYEFVNTTVGIFVNVFIFLQTGSFSFLVIFSLFQFTGTFVGFVIFGYIIARNQYSIKWNYLRSFIVYFFCFILLASMPRTEIFFLIFAFFNGLGLGLFWLSNHTYEMLYTNNKNGERDFYSSILQGGNQLISICAPMIGTFLIFLSASLLKIETFKLLFWFLPFVYLLSLPFLFKLPDFIPPIITISDIKSFFSSRISKKIKSYYILNTTEEIKGVAVTFFTITALKTVINIGLWQTSVAVIAFFITIMLARIRYEGNRLSIMLYSIFGLLIAYFFIFFSNVSIYFFIVYSLLLIVLKPIYRVSQHATDLRSIDFLSREKKSFYPGILYRETVIYLGRFLFLVLLICISSLLEDNLLSARIAIIIYAIALFSNWFVATKMIKENNAL